MIYEFEGWRPRVAASAFIAPTATLIGNVVVEEDASIWFGAVLRSDNGERCIRVGARSNVQDGCILHVSTEHDTIVGTDVTVGHGAILEGCTIGDRVVVGMNAVVLEDVEVGEGSMIAAGSVLTVGMRVPAGVLVAGAPAKVKKEISGSSAWWIEHSARHYVERTQRYRTRLRG